MDIQKERKAFESWIKKDYPEILELISNSDVKQAYDFAWEVWQAKAQTVPEGFSVVPKEPTLEMIEAAAQEHAENGASYRTMYKAMISAGEKK